MPFSHHSHSGQFCGHAANTLEEVIQRAIQMGMTTFCTTEHIYRKAHDFYPEEADYHTEQTLQQLFDDYYHEARRLQQAYADQIEIFVGFEGEWIRPESYDIIQEVLKKYPMDIFVGSIHHVQTVPIDFDTAMYHQSRELAGGTDERIFEDYFDSQYEMLQKLKPPIIGHFDLIRLKSDDPERSFTTWPAVWSKIIRNLEFIAGYGGIVELNSSSLRKGMTEAYPQVEICQTFLRLGGKFTLSDDSHGVDQVGLNFHKVLECIDKAGITQLSVLSKVSESAKDDIHDSRFPHVRWTSTPIEDLKRHAFWQKRAALHA